ncbi:MAG: hypothetical protein K6G24_07885 [Lachnospiraceae bacterium]|nr:hypothetical protein [Lachnospiraceae bacterium]
MIGWIILGLAATALTVAYWDRIRDWLNTIVADKIEKIFGYGARKRVHHAVSIADRFHDKIRNRLFVFVKKVDGTGYDKYMEKEARVIEDVEDAIVQEIDEKETLIEEFKYGE